MKSLVFKIIISILSVMIGWGCSQAKGDESVLSMILTGSMHGQLDPCGWKKNPMGGLPRRLTKINEIRTSDSNPLIVDAGDFFFSTKKINTGNKQSEKIRAESILKGYEKIGYDILNVGEYETLVGLPFLKMMSEKVSVPFISANLKDKSTNQLIFDPY